MARAKTAAPEPSTSLGGRAELPPRGAPDVLYLVDLSGYVFRAYHAITPLSSSKGEPTHAVMGTVNMLQKVVNEKQPSYLAVAMDSKGPTFRKTIDARYKANRPPPPEDLSQQLARCEAIVRAYNIPIYQEAGIEADDLIASVVKRARASGLRVVIVSSDKDMMQLVDDQKTDVVLWDSMRDRVYGPAEVQAKLGVVPSRVRDYLALTGDSSDNVPGVPSVGPKTAADLLGEFGSVDGIYARIGEVKRQKLRETLQAHESDARVSQKLVTLKDDVAIAWDLEHLKYGGADTETLRALYTDLEFTRHLDALAPAAPTKRELYTILDAAALARVLDTARTTKLLAVHPVLTDADPMRAAIVGLALAAKPGEGHYVPISHRYLGVPKQLAWAEVAAALAPVLADENVTKVAYDLKTAEIVLAELGLSLAGKGMDPMIASYLLDPETPNSIKELARRELGLDVRPYGEGAKKGTQVPFDQLPVEEATPYAASDAEIALSLATRLDGRLDREGMGALMRDLELPLAHVLAGLERTGVLVDTTTLEALGHRVEGELRALEQKARSIAGRDFAIRSRDQLETILFDELKLPVLKRTPKGGRSTDAEVLEELAEQHELPKVIVEYREIDKLKGTYIDALPRAKNPRTGRIHTRFQQTVAATGRLSSSDPNLQNIPVRSELGREIRAAFVAPPGAVILSADYSQIELRVLAHLSRDPQLLEAFHSGGDIHTHTASLVFDVTKDAVTVDMRRSAKTINFGVIYGMGDAALARQLDIPRADAARFIEAYFRRYEGVARFMQETIESARRGEAVRTVLGRRRFLPNLHSANRGLRMEAERIAKNTPIQGSAADILKIAMVRLGKGEVVPGARMILTVHDELVFEVPEASAKEAGELVREAMSGAMKLDVPLVVDVGFGPNWAKAK
ncbi:MAG: DNA polymerase I [Polyangiaceae bacterium]